MRTLFMPLVAALMPLVSSVSKAEVPRKFLPVDEAAKDPSFFVFRSRLIEAVIARDAAHVVGILSPKILNNFGGDGGIAEFKGQWKPEDPASKLWTELGRVLSLGGKFTKDGGFSAPYYSAAWPEDDSADPFEFVAIVGENIRVREKPNADSGVIAKVSFELVRVEDQQDGASDEWTKIKLSDGRKGFVASRLTGSPIGWRANFTKENGEWRMTAFVAGD